ncbi:MAG: response regulator transcription factor [Ilumatobacteraceae bacterium]|nr:response regulator transcription factor [Ilumatobacteraceae bacterium]
MRLILVDDHQLLRDSLKRQFEELGHEVVADFSDGTRAVSAALTLRPDVILMDISMSEGDGIAATQAIVDADARQRVVMLTMHTETDIVRRALKAGAVGYVTKDSSFSQVLEAVLLAHDGDIILSPDLATALLAESQFTHENQEKVITEREEQVLQLLADGLSTPEIAERLFISQKTVKNHLASIYEKIDARDRTQAVIRGIKMGIIKFR